MSRGAPGPTGLAPLPGGALLSAARGAPRALLQAGGGIVSDPARLVRLGALARDDAGALARLLTGRDPGTLLKGELGVERRVAWSAAIALERVKAIRRASAASVNDVLLAALAGALHRYLAGRGSLVERLRAIVPFTLRPPDRPPPRRLGNNFGVVYLPFPVGLADPGERLAAVKREMDALNRSPAEGAVAYALLAGSGRSLPQLEMLVVERLAARASAVMTNIPRPAPKRLPRRRAAARRARLGALPRRPVAQRRDPQLQRTDRRRPRDARRASCPPRRRSPPSSSANSTRSPRTPAQTEPHRKHIPAAASHLHRPASRARPALRSACAALRPRDGGVVAAAV